ncbi:cytidylyltransferase domain-containing protein [Pseudomonas gingeri]|uniref:acylneuraminate cytidylyltransferase family protein n=1 Tax=Pseudomonas gingeri TaxID=117681 RepID=UPI0015A01517|nr:hypothetical protein [Pseudomonas gingeri]NWA10348.1 hypothetical protein [Pseudomonas gingeri]
MSAIAIIPARGGSKRIPRKNLKLFHGEPMIARSIRLALACGLFDRVMVSTDDPEIAALARVLRDMGAEVLFACRELPGNAFARLAQEGVAALVLPPLYCGENPALGIEALLPWDCRPCASPLRKTSRPTPSAWPRLACISISAPAVGAQRFLELRADRLGRAPGLAGGEAARPRMPAAGRRSARGAGGRAALRPRGQPRRGLAVPA